MDGHKHARLTVFRCETVAGCFDLGMAVFVSFPVFDAFSCVRRGTVTLGFNYLRSRNPFYLFGCLTLRTLPLTHRKNDFKKKILSDCQVEGPMIRRRS